MIPAAATKRHDSVYVTIDGKLYRMVGIKAILRRVVNEKTGELKGGKPEWGTIEIPPAAQALLGPYIKVKGNKKWK